LKKALAAALIVGVTLIIPGAAFAEKLQPGRPPCSIMHKNHLPTEGPMCEEWPYK